MKKFCILPVVTALALFGSCEKPQTEEQKKAEVERQVQERLAAERQSDEQQRLRQQQDELAARVNELAAKQAVAASSPSSTIARTTESTRKTRSSSETRSSASYGTFYRKLESYGAWFETTDYGYVWQPREAEESRTWRPYTDGRWVYTDAGWTWVSDEPFGWATYHYGRWTRLRNVGWIWVPGEEWAPAWVSWRTSNQYVGWAPLPPEAHFDRRRGIHNWADNYYDIGPDQYSFVPDNEFGSRRIQRAIVPVDRNVTIVNQTTNVTNITYNNTTVVNQGPNYDELRSRSQQPIERYRLERQVQMNGETAEPIVRGEVIEMPAPVIGRVPGMDRPRTVKETLTQAIVDTGWAAITDRSAAERARAKMKSEATPPPDAPPKTFVKPENTATTSTSTSATTAATATPAVAATSTVAATPTSTPTPRPTATLTPTVASSSSPSATPLFMRRPKASPSPTASPVASASPEERTVPSAIPTASLASIPSRATQLETQRMAAEQKRQFELQQQQKRAAEQAKKAEEQRARGDKAMEELRSRAQKTAPPGKMEQATPETELTPSATAAPVSSPAATQAPFVPPAHRSPRGPLPTRPFTPSESTPSEISTPAPITTPRVTPPRPIVTPPPNKTATHAASPSPGEKKPVVPDSVSEAAPTPAAHTTPIASPSASSSPPPADQKAKNKKHKRPGQSEEGETEPTPAGSAAPE